MNEENAHAYSDSLQQYLFDDLPKNLVFHRVEAANRKQARKRKKSSSKKIRKGKKKTPRIAKLFAIFEPPYQELASHVLGFAPRSP